MKPLGSAEKVRFHFIRFMPCHDPRTGIATGRSWFKSEAVRVYVKVSYPLLQVGQVKQA